MSDPIVWRGYTVPPADEPKLWRFDDQVYICVDNKGDGTWCACIIVGDLQGTSEVAIDAHSALETALVALKAEITRHQGLIEEAFR